MIKDEKEEEEEKKTQNIVYQKDLRSWLKCLRNFPVLIHHIFQNKKEKKKEKVCFFLLSQ